LGNNIKLKSGLGFKDFEALLFPCAPILNMGLKALKPVLRRRRNN